MKKLYIYLALAIMLPVLLSAQGIIVTPGTDMTVNSGSVVKVTNGGDFTIRADANETGSFIDKNTTNQVLFSGGGEAKVELFLSEDNWHYISSPMTDALSGVFLNIYLKEFNEPDSLWVYITSVTEPLSPLKGYASWASSSLTGDVTVTFNGSFNAGSYSNTLTNTGNGGHGSKGFNFVGNPFASAVDWQLGTEAWTRTNIDPTVYLWNPTAGQYGTYNRTIKLSTHSVDSIIPPKQGFFVHVTSNGTGTFGVNNAARLHHHKAFFKSMTLPPYPELLKLTVTGNSYNDEAILYFNENATAGFDSEYDAFKVQGLEEAPQLCFLANQIQLTVNTLSEVTEELVVPVGFETGATGMFSITTENLESFEAGIPIYLEDIKENSFQNLRQNPLYDFYYESFDESHRFNLHFAEPLGTDEQSLLAQVHIYGYQKTIYVKMPPSTSGEVYIYNLMGELVTNNRALAGLNSYPVIQGNVYYSVKVISGKDVISKKIFIK